MSADKAKKYMLFVYGDFNKGDELVRELTAEFATIIESNYMKFIFNPHSFVAHFSSKVPFEDLKIHIDQVLSFQVEQYFLTEMSSDFAVGMNPELMNGLFDLENEDDEKSIITMKMILNDFVEDGENGLMDFLKNLPQIMEKVINEEFDDEMPKKRKKTLSLDEVLDKITEEGIESLTEEEKETLENYARRQ